MTAPIESWLPWPAGELRVFKERTPENLMRAAEQFHVENNVRYRPWLGRTFCNIFIWDVTRALDCEIPHWVMPDGQPAAPFVRNAREQTANDIHQWLSLYGGVYGWKYLGTQDEAEMRADLGYPTVAVWFNPHGSGHVALILPHGKIIQAGKSNGVMLMEQGFGKHKPDFYTHD